MSGVKSPLVALTVLCCLLVFGIFDKIAVLLCFPPSLSTVKSNTPICKSTQGQHVLRLLFAQTGRKGCRDTNQSRHMSHNASILTPCMCPRTKERYWGRICDINAMPLLHEVPQNLVKRDLCRLFRDLAGVFVESSICAVLLLLDRGAELEQVVGHVLVRCFEYVDQAGIFVSRVYRV
jgi:hypothetical protein